jgi:hypothetical protein
VEFKGKNEGRTQDQTNPKTTPNVKENEKGEIFSPSLSMEYLPVALGVNLRCREKMGV